MAENSTGIHHSPGDHPNDHHYLFEGHCHLLTELERRARRRLLMEQKVAATTNEGLKSMLARQWLKEDDDVSHLLAQGEKHFYADTMRRIMTETPEALNTCPRCGSLCRTHRACLCPHCSHTWFETRSNFHQADQPASEK